MIFKLQKVREIVCSIKQRNKSHNHFNFYIYQEIAKLPHSHKLPYCCVLSFYDIFSELSIGFLKENYIQYSTATSKRIVSHCERVGLHRPPPGQLDTLSWKNIMPK